MALSYAAYTGDGSNRNFAVPFPYISKDHVTLLVSGSPVAFTWLSPSLVQASVAPAAAAPVRVQRTTPNTNLLVDFSDASTLTESDLDLNAQQALYIAQETSDVALSMDTLDHWDGKNKRLINLADPVDPTDATSKGWVEATFTGATTLATQKAAEAAASADLAAQKATDASTTKDAIDVDVTTVAGYKDDAHQSLLDAQAAAAAAAQSAQEAVDAAGGGLQPSQNLADVANPSTALSNLGGLAKSANLADVVDPSASWRNLGGFDLSSVVSITAGSTLTSAAFGKLHYVTGTANITTMLPTPVNNAGKVIGFICGKASDFTKLHTVQTPAGNIGRSGTSIVMWAHESVLLRSNGVDWQVLQAKQIPFLGTLKSNVDTNISATFTACQLNSATGDPTGLNLAYDATNKNFKSPRSSQYQFNAYTYQTQTSGVATNQMQIQGIGIASGVYSWTGSINAGTIYGSSLFTVNAGVNVGVYGRGDGTSPKIAASAVGAYLDYHEVCPTW